MTPLDVSFELADKPQWFVHIRSKDGILGHAEEVRKRVPVGVWINVQPALQPTVTTFLMSKCGFAYRGAMMVGDELCDLLQRVEE